MAETSIEWTDRVWNPVRGCTKISPGCKHCYAETFAERWRGVAGHPYEQGFDLRLVPEKLAEPLGWRRPSKVFVNSMSDLFHEKVPREYIAAVFGVMAAAKEHTFQVLTKRADVMRQWMEWADSPEGPSLIQEACRYLDSVGFERGCGSAFEADDWPLPNVWMGVSVEDRKYGIPRIEQLKATPAHVRFLSVEPLLEDLGPLDFGTCAACDGEGEYAPEDWGGAMEEGRTCEKCHGTGRLIHWVIVGGESGQKARPCNLTWVENVVHRCTEAGVPVFVKQLGARWATLNRSLMPDGKGGTERDSKGGYLLNFPETLRVRQFP
jgi:protein gp37